MATFLFSDFFSDAALWTTWDPDYIATPLPIVGNAAASDRNVCSCTLVNMSEHTPAMIAFVDSRDTDTILFAHSPVFCPDNPMHNSACDNHVMAIMGNNSGRAISVALPAAAFAHVTNVRCLRLQEAAAHLMAAPPVLNQGPHNNATPNTDVIKVC